MVLMVNNEVQILSKNLEEEKIIILFLILNETVHRSLMKSTPDINVRINKFY